MGAPVSKMAEILKKLPYMVSGGDLRETWWVSGVLYEDWEQKVRNFVSRFVHELFYFLENRDPQMSSQEPHPQRICKSPADHCLIQGSYPQRLRNLKWCHIMWGSYPQMLGVLHKKPQVLWTKIGGRQLPMEKLCTGLLSSDTEDAILVSRNWAL